MRFTLIIILSIFIIPLSLYANSPGTVGFQFLRTQVGARPAALGGAFVAVAKDVSCLYYNPAGIATFSQKTASFTYLNHVLDFGSGFVGVVRPQFGPGNLGVSVLYMNYGDFAKTDINGQEMGSFSANSIALSTSYALSPMKNLYVGASFKYIRASIDTYSSDAIAVDAGVLYAIPSQALTIALSFTNFGSATSAFIESKPPLPSNIRLGFAKQLAHLPLMLGFNLYKYQNEDWHGALGGEFILTDKLLLRIGYDNAGRDMHVDSSKDRFAGAALGLGLLWRSFRIDYSYTSYGVIGALNRFSVSGQF